MQGDERKLFFYKMKIQLYNCLSNYLFGGLFMCVLLLLIMGCLEGLIEIAQGGDDQILN